MSLSSIPILARVFRRTSGYALFSALALALSGCIQPLYGPGVGGDSVAAEMQAIKIEPIPDRLGHYVENELIFALNGTGSSPAPKYRLIVTLHERMATPVINTVTGQAEAGDVNVDADYRLLPIAGGGQPIATGNVTQFRCLRSHQPATFQCPRRTRCRNPQCENARRPDPHPHRSHPGHA